jgi:hypothetical protein
MAEVKKKVQMEAKDEKETDQGKCLRGVNLRPREVFDEAKLDGGQDRSQGGSQCSALSKNHAEWYHTVQVLSL